MGPQLICQKQKEDQQFKNLIMIQSKIFKRVMNLKLIRMVTFLTDKEIKFLKEFKNRYPLRLQNTLKVPSKLKRQKRVVNHKEYMKMTV